MVIARNRTPSQCVALIITIKSAVQERKGSLVKDIKPSQKEKSDYIFSFGNINVKCVFRVWDEADYVVPPAENGAFFITTNVLITPNQVISNVIS